MEGRFINGQTLAMSSNVIFKYRRSNAIFKFWFSPCDNLVFIRWAQSSGKLSFH